MSEDLKQQMRALNLDEAAFTDMYYNTRRLAEEMKSVHEQLKELPKMESTLRLINLQLESLAKITSDVDNLETELDKIKTSVSIHHTILYIGGVVCLAFIPIMASWNMQLRNELKELRSKSDTQAEKIINLERSTYEDSGAIYDPSSGEYYLGQFRGTQF